MEKRWIFILSVGVVVAHVPDKCLVLFIFIPGEDNGVGKPDNPDTRNHDG